MANLSNSGFSVEVDGMDKEKWSEVVSSFDDAILYQTWSYGSVRWGAENLSHLVLKKDGEAMAAAQLRIMRLPVVGAGVAYVAWGPLWRRRGREPDPEVFRLALRALREEYSRKRRLALQIVSAESADDGAAHALFKEEGFARRRSVPARRTIYLNLRQSAEDLRKNFHKTWRRNLKLSEKNDLEIEHGTGPELFDAFCEVHRELIERKRFVEYVDPREYKKIQEDLPPEHKMEVMVCRHEGAPVGAVVWSGIGNTVLDTLAATNEAGRDLRVAYLLRWREWVWMLERGYGRFDFGGINPEGVPGVYRFKSHAMGKNGKNGQEARQAGRYDVCDALASGLAVGLADRARLAFRFVKQKINNMLYSSRR